MLQTMKFFAILRPGSAIHRLWRERSQRGGVVDHVKFTLHGNRYKSAELTEEQVDKLKVRQAQDIEFEAFGVTPDIIESTYEDNTGDTSDTDTKTPKESKTKKLLKVESEAARTRVKL